MPDFKIKEGDDEPAMEVTLTDEAGAFDLSALTNPTVTAVVGRFTTPPIVNKEINITDAANGVVELVWADGETDSRGTYRAEFVVEHDDGTRTFPNDGYVSVQIVREVKDT